MVSLKGKAVSSVKWTTFQTVFVAVSAPLLQVIKARFLSPEAFAYIAIIMIFIGLFKIIENMGISQAVIQSDNIDEKDTSSLFFFNILFSLILGILLFYLSPFIARFFSLPDLNYYLKITSIIVLAGGPSHLFRAFLQKYFHFKELSVIEMVRNISMLIIVTIFLVLDFGVIGVIYANVITTILSTLLIGIACFKNKLLKILPYFNIKRVYPFLRFGVYVSAKGMLTYGATRMDEVLIGYFLAPDVLGVYYFGKHMLDKVRGLITASFAAVLFPVFSKIKEDREKLSLAYKKISGYISFVSFPVITGIAVTAHLFVPVIFGEQWVDSIIVFQVFSLASLFLVLTASVSTSLLYSVNKPGLVFYIDIATDIVYFSSLVIFASKGMFVILLMYSLYIIYKTITLQFFANRQLTHSFISYLFELKPATILTIAMVTGVLVFQFSTQGFVGNIYQFVGSVGIGALIYLSLALVTQKLIINDIKTTFMKGPVVKV